MTDKPEAPSKRKPRQPKKGSKAAPRTVNPGGLSDDEWDKLPQREKFIRMAREAGCEDNLGRLDEALRRIASAGPAPREAAKHPRKTSRS